MERHNMDESESPPHVTLRDIARALGISHTTVALALNDHPKIPEMHRKEIRAMAQQMGYNPTPAALALSQFKKTSTVTPVRAALAWLNFWPEPKKLRSYEEFNAYWRGAAAAAERFGYNLEEFVGNDCLPISRLEKILLARGINGILLPPVGGKSTPPNLSDIHWEHFSAIRLGRSLPHPKVNVVTSDQVANAIMAFNEIRVRGYDRIGFVASQAREWGGLFEAGFLMAQQSLEERMRLPIFTVGSDPNTTVKEFGCWLKREKPDAVFTDVPATPDMLKKCGYRVPEDIGLAVTSILDAGADAGVYQNPEEIGHCAVLATLSLINANVRGVPPIVRQILVSGTWVDGSTLPNRS
jgi:DNA-binding LacI/PurR family transcriptional regulator